ncbi:MAG: PTS lactose/cellobiose transporter subunit IIA [Clostridiales bacterium]|nr:PTS lactose/cellobiose transporter subunit IIA [Clostridiales bacterium]
MAEKTEQMEEKQAELVRVAIQIIMHAGDARLKIYEALAHAKKFDFEQANLCMQDADEKITEAHRSQTEVIQREAGGDSYPHSLIFAHAQDTIMTINSEVKLARELIDILKIIDQKTRG